jgi:hypothetical protein
MRGATGQRASTPPDLPERLPPAVLVRSAGEAAEILRLAAGRPVLLLSAPAAGGALGARGWRALVARAAAEVPGAPFADALCCGAAPGQALAALRQGCRILVLDGACAAFPAVAGAAAELGARVLPARPAALDPRGLDLRQPAIRDRIAQWLTGQVDDREPIWR